MINRKNILRRVGVFVFLIIVGVCVFLLNENATKSYAINTDNIPSELSNELISYSGDFYGDNDPITGIAIKPYYGNPVGNTQTVFDFFCLNRNMEFANDFSFVPPTEEGVSSKLPYAYVVLAIHEVDGYNYDDGLERYLRQIAVWLYEYEKAGMPTDESDPNYMSSEEIASIKASSYYSYISALLTAAKNAVDPFDAPPTVNVSYDGKWIVDGENIVTSEISVSGTSLDSYVVSLSSVTSGNVLVDGNIISAGTSIDISKKFKISIPISNIDVSKLNFSIDINANYEAYEAHRFVPNDAQDACQEVYSDGKTACDKVQDILTFIRKTNTVQADTALTIPTGDIKIAKVKAGEVSVDGSNLSGSVLCIVDSSSSNCDNAIYEFTSTASISNYTLAPGSYKVIEKTAPSGYIKSDKSYRFAIDANGNVTVDGVASNLITIENAPVNVVINKVDEDNKAIAGAVIDIYKVADDNSRSLINTITSIDSDTGVAVFNSDGSPLSFGSYVAIETAAPDGYFLDDEEKPFDISEDNRDITLTFKNDKNELEIIKYNEKGEVLSGASFAVTTSSTSTLNPVYTCISGSQDNPCIFTMVAPGTYYVHETSAPLGYKKSDEVKEVTITNKTKDKVSITYTNTKKGLSILKTDYSGNAVSGAQLVLNTSNEICDANTCVPYNNDNTYKWTSTAVAKDISELPVGTYYIHEIQAPNGYVIDTTPFEIVIYEEDVSKVFTFPNDKTSVSIEKVDKSETSVVGAILQVYRGTEVDEDNFVEEWTTDGKPHELKGLEFGNYILYEKSAASGYYASESVVPFVVDQNTRNIPIKMYNEKKKITVLKTDKNGNAVSGAVLALYDSSGKTMIGNPWTSSNLPYDLGNLSNGNYCVKELQAPQGYIRSDKSECFSVDDNTTNLQVAFKNEQIILRLAKVDSLTGINIPGATLKLTRKDGDMQPITFISSEVDYEVTGIRPGTYVLEEIQAPYGYITSSSKIEFDVYETGKVQTKQLLSNNAIVSINNKQLSINCNGISGFKFKLMDATGNVIENIDVNDSIYTSQVLSDGEYYLEEVEVPSGYILNTNKINFFITDSGNNEVIRFSNDYTKVVISKRDITNGEEIPGAYLELKDSDGNIIEGWFSTSEVHVINRKLEVGKTYYLKETIAPSGYEIASSEIAFEVEASGLVQVVVMDNTPKVDVPDTTKGNSIIYIVIGIIIFSLGASMVVIACKNTKI